MNAECTIVAGSCDKYADVLGPFIALFRKFWPDCPFELVLVTESDPHIAGFDRVVPTGRGKHWCAMLAEALEQVATRHVILLMDDYLLTAPVDTRRILARLAEARRYDAANLRLNPNPPGRTRFRDTDLLEMPKNTAYCVSCQTGIWNREFLLGLARRNKSAWEFERYGSFQTGGETRPLLVTPAKEFPFVDAVHKGCWEKFGVDVCRANGIAIDFSKRGLPPFKTRLAEGAKALVFAIFPATLIVRIQNLLALGKKEGDGQGDRRRPARGPK